MNLSLLNATEQPTMSSREIATLCQKSHDNVLKLVRSLIEGGIVKSTTPHQYTHPQNGQTYTEYLSDKRDSLIIVARLSPEFTAAVIDRWQELEATKPATPAEMLLMVAEQMVITERKTAELDLRLTAIEQKQQRLDQDNDHYTIKGFCALHGLGLSGGKMSALSKKAKKLSQAKDYAYHQITDPRFGTVYCYHVDILTELFALNHLL